MTDLGQRIRRLRTAQQITQTALAGDQITRNMLSQIENGTAQPSLPTILYLAQKLNIPAGYFLSEEDDEFLYRKMQYFPHIKQAYAEEKWQKCMEICQEKLNGTDDEINFILCRCAYQLALQAYAEGRLCAAHTEFVQCLEYAPQSMYDSSPVVKTAYDYLSYLSRFDSALEIPGFIKAPRNTMTADHPWFTCYLYVLRLIEGGELETAEHLLAIPDFASKAYAAHARARVAMARRSYAEALQIIETILTPERGLPPGKPLTYLLYVDLEICCRETGDFERAYRYTTQRVKLLDVLLTE